MPEPVSTTIMVPPDIFNRVKRAIERELPNAQVVEFPKQLWADPEITEYYLRPKEL